jgi:antitoxin CptB
MSEADRLRWRCRRGLLELDLVLLRFLDGQYSQLPPFDRQAFESLLQLQDDTLLEMIFGTGKAEPRFSDLLERLRQC